MFLDDHMSQTYLTPIKSISSEMGVIGLRALDCDPSFLSCLGYVLPMTGLLGTCH